MGKINDYFVDPSDLLSKINPESQVPIKAIEVKAKNTKV